MANPFLKAYNAVVPINVRAYLEAMGGRKSAFTEEDYSDSDMQAQREVAMRALTEWGKPAREDWQDDPNETPEEQNSRFLAWSKKNNNISPRDQRTPGTVPSIQYEHYFAPETENNFLDQYARAGIIPKLSDPSLKLATTIGRAVLKPQEDNQLMLRDKYKFNVVGGAFSESPEESLGRGEAYSALREFGQQMVGTEPAFDVNVNLGNPDTWDYSQVPLGYDRELLYKALGRKVPE